MTIKTRTEQLKWLIFITKELFLMEKDRNKKLQLMEEIKKYIKELKS